MHTARSVRAITHIHTCYSNGEASELDAAISGTVRRLFGAATPAEPWRECFTTVEQLVALLRLPEAEGGCGVVVITDHMNGRSHRLPDALLCAAAAEPGLALGTELYTVDFDVDGTLRTAPEVLLYGTAEPVKGPHGGYYGISQALLDELYATCRAPGSDELWTSKVLDFCADRRLAYALAHPFDGHELSLAAMVEIISRARFVETVNGGFPSESTHFLRALVSLHNLAVGGAKLRAAAAARWPLGAALVQRIQEEHRDLVHPWGGSDAHSHAFARVTVRFRCKSERPNAGDLFAAMLRGSVAEILAARTFTIEGEPGTSLSVLDDVVRIVARNLKRSGTLLLKHPHLVAPVLWHAQREVRWQLGSRARRREEMLRELAQAFPVDALVESMQPGAALVRLAPQVAHEAA